jgi:hypothetical protein
MRSHISVHRATTKYFCNSFVFKTKIGKEGLPRDRTPDLGAGGLRFKSGRPDQNISRIFFSLLKASFTSNPICEILADRRSGLASRLLSESSPHEEFAKTGGGRSAIWKVVNGGKLSAHYFASMGKIQGILRISRLIYLRKRKSVNRALGSARASPCLSIAS